MNGKEQDEVLSLADSSDSFSGFSSEELPEKQKSKKGRVKSVVFKPVASTSSKGKSAKSKNTAKNTAKKTSENVSQVPNVALDINKLSEADISNLREALGIQQPVLDPEPFETFVDRPNLRIEVDSRDVSDYEEPSQPSIGFDKSRALFEDSGSDNNEYIWNLPKLKTPLKGKPIAKSLAEMINMSCSTQCDVDALVAKYKVPENCDRACPPMVNPEIWRVMEKRTQPQDRGIVDIQNLVAAGLTPIIKLAETMKKQIMDNSEAKDYFSDALVILGQVQYMLSTRRRYMIRPSLKKKFQGLCNISMPVTTKLFGDDISKEIKACESFTSLGREPYYPKFNLARGRGNPRFSGRGSFQPHGSFQSQSGYGANRYTPYPMRGQNRPSRGFASYRIPRKSATVTSAAPNEQK